MKRGQAASDRVRNKIDIAHAKFAAFFEIAFRFDCAEKLLCIVHQISREPYSLRVAHDGEEPFARARVIEPLDCRSQAVLRNPDADLSRGDLLDRVRFIQNEEIIREKETALPFFLRLGASQKHKEQGVIDHQDVGRQQTFARLLIKTARILAARFLCADVRFAADLRPYFRVGLDCEIAERAIVRGARPCVETTAFLCCARANKIAGAR